MLIVFCVALFATALGIDKYVQTPHGLRLAQCVHTAEEYEAVITEIANGTHDGILLSYPKTGGSTFHPTLPECLEDVQRLKKVFKLARAKKSTNSPLVWVDNASEDTPSMKSFEGYYTLPNENPQNEGQLLYFFLGMENFDGRPLTIIQPVVSYQNGWAMAAWNCCPRGQTTKGSTISLPASAANIHTLVSSDQNNVFITMTYNGQTSSLTQPDIGRKFSYIDVTLEQYSVEQCNGYNRKPFNFTNLKLTTTSGQNFAPSWSLSGNSQCNGGPVLYDNYNIGMYGTGKPAAAVL